MSASASLLMRDTILQSVRRICKIPTFYTTIGFAYTRGLLYGNASNTLFPVCLRSS